MGTNRTISTEACALNILAAAAQGQILGLEPSAYYFGWFIAKIDEQKGALLTAFWQAIYQVMMCITQLFMRAFTSRRLCPLSKVVAPLVAAALKPLAYSLVVSSSPWGLYSLVLLPSLYSGWAA